MPSLSFLYAGRSRRPSPLGFTLDGRDELLNRQHLHSFTPNLETVFGDATVRISAAGFGEGVTCIADCRLEPR